MWEEHVLSTHVKFHIKLIFFMPCVKKRKKISQEMDYFSTKIDIFYIGHNTCHFLLKQLCEHAKYQDIHETISVFFDILNILYLLIRGTIKDSTLIHIIRIILRRLDLKFKVRIS
jgi:hypothetical protein